MALLKDLSQLSRFAWLGIMGTWVPDTICGKRICGAHGGWDGNRWPGIFHDFSPHEKATRKEAARLEHSRGRIVMNELCDF